MSKSAKFVAVLDFSCIFPLSTPLDLHNVSDIELGSHDIESREKMCFLFVMMRVVYQIEHDLKKIMKSLMETFLQRNYIRDRL